MIVLYVAYFFIIFEKGEKSTMAEMITQRVKNCPISGVNSRDTCKKGLFIRKCTAYKGDER